MLNAFQAASFAFDRSVFDFFGLVVFLIGVRLIGLNGLFLQ
jgi:hypothetical protein